MTDIVTTWIFWLATAFIVYTYALYPLLIVMLARLRERPVRRHDAYRPQLTVIIAAHNEAANLRRRIDNLLAQDYPSENVTILIVSDGSTDATGAIAEQLAQEYDTIHALCLAVNRGKAVALNAALELARGELIVFADARQTFAPDVLARLAENFADPTVGSVSGELILTDSRSGIAAQVGLYWRYEKLLRRSESAVGSMLGATGAIYALRRELWTPLPEGTLLDDFLTPMRIVLRGRRALFDGRARAYDQASQHADQEWRRKIRTLAGNFQAFALEPALLLPWRNPTTWFQVWSHKVFRLLVPYALVLAYFSCLLGSGAFHTAAFALQTAFYLAAFVGWRLERSGRPSGWKIISLAYTFTLLNAAAAGGLWFWMHGHNPGSLWKKAYTEGEKGEVPPSFPGTPD